MFLTFPWACSWIAHQCSIPEEWGTPYVLINFFLLKRIISLLLLEWGVFTGWGTDSTHRTQLTWNCDLTNKREFSLFPAGCKRLWAEVAQVGKLNCSYLWGKQAQHSPGGWVQLGQYSCLCPEPSRAEPRERPWRDATTASHASLHPGEFH